MFQDFGKIPRLTRQCVVTEKLDGTNAQVFIGNLYFKKTIDKDEEPKGVNR
jgi:hypothetical protein